MSPGELAVVCQRFDLGPAIAAIPVHRGSRASPKTRLRTERGDFLIKRRSPARADPLRVASGHEVQAHLVARGFRAPALHGTRAEGATALHHAGAVYEVMAFVPGEPFARSPAQAADAGRCLAEFHAGMTGFVPRFAPGRGRLHASPRVVGWLTRAADSAGGEAQRALRELRRLYQRAGERVEAAGFPTWPRGLIHGDWHPGNLLFTGDRVAAVVDFDAVRHGALAEDVAIAGVQFSIVRAGNDPAAWPDAPDEPTLAAVLAGYRGAQPGWPGRGVPEALGPLMVEALISEATLTLRIAEPDTSPIVREMILRKAVWLASHAGRVAELATDRPTA